jgi:hypothetical protein
MITLNEAAVPRKTSFLKHLSAYSIPFPVSEIKEKDQMLAFHVGSAVGAIALMPAPIPWPDLEGPCETAWYWPDASKALRKHSNHLLVSLLSPEYDAITTAQLLTCVTAAASESCDATGIYWGEGTLVHLPRTFVDQAKEMTRDYLPLYLWIDFRVQSHGKDAYDLFTTGLKYFGHMEIEVRNTRLEPMELIGRVFNVAHYLLDNGPVLKHGDTIGGDEKEKVRIKHAASMWDKSQKVLVLEM